MIIYMKGDDLDKNEETFCFNKRLEETMMEA